MRARGGSLYLTQLREKQKVRRMYGLLEKQFAKLMKEAVKADGLTDGTMVISGPEQYLKYLGQTVTVGSAGQSRLPGGF